MVLKASPASNPFNPLRGSESFLSSSESRKMPSWTHNKSSQEQPSGVVWCVYYLSVYGVDSGCSRPFYAPLNSLTRLASDSERVGYARLPGRNEHVTGVLKKFPIHRVAYRYIIYGMLTSLRPSLIV